MTRPLPDAPLDDPPTPAEVTRSEHPCYASAVKAMAAELGTNDDAHNAYAALIDAQLSVVPVGWVPPPDTELTVLGPRDVTLYDPDAPALFILLPAGGATDLHRLDHDDPPTLTPRGRALTRALLRYALDQLDSTDD